MQEVTDVIRLHLHIVSVNTGLVLYSHDPIAAKTSSAAAVAEAVDLLLLSSSFATSSFQSLRMCWKRSPASNRTTRPASSTTLPPPQLKKSETLVPVIHKGCCYKVWLLDGTNKCNALIIISNTLFVEVGFKYFMVENLI